MSTSDAPATGTGATTDTGTASGNGEGRFTQADVDRIVSERLKRASADDQTLEQLRQAAGSVPKLEARIATLERERDAARTEAAESGKRADSAALRAEVMGAATRAGAIDPEDVFALLPADSVKLEDGKVTGADEAVKSLAERKAHLFASPRRPPAGDGGARSDGGKSGAGSTDMNTLLRRGAGLQ